MSRPKQDKFSSKAWRTYGKKQPKENEGAKDREKGCGMLSSDPDSHRNDKDTEPAQDQAC